MKMKVTLRKYRTADCPLLAQLFYDTVHAVNKADYSGEQLDAWADGAVDLDAWDAFFRKHHTVIAEKDGQIVGFGDISEEGYLDRLYVHKDYQHQGIAGIICDHLEQSVKVKKITTHASITARNFMELFSVSCVSE